MRIAKKQSFLYGGIILMISMVIVKIIGALFKIPLTNILGLTGIGYFSSAYNVYVVFYALTVTGLSSATARLVAEKQTQHRYNDVKRALKLSLAVFLLLGVVGSVSIALFSSPFSKLINSENSRLSLLMIAPAVFFCCVMAAFRGYYEGLLNMMPTAVVQVIEAVSKLAFGLLFANVAINYYLTEYSSFTPKEKLYEMSLPYAAGGAMLGVSIGTALGLVYLMIYYLVNKKNKLQDTLIVNTKEPYYAMFKNLFTTALPITLSAVVLQLSSLIDTVTIQKRLILCQEKDINLMNMLYNSAVTENEQTTEILYGAFVTCISLFNILPAFSGIFARSALPNITMLWTKKDYKSLGWKISEIIKVTSVIIAPMTATLMIMSKEVITVLFNLSSPKMLLTANILSLLAVPAFLLALVVPINSIFQAIGKPKLPLKILAIGALIKLFFNVWLCGIPKINIYGGALSTFFCYLFIFIATFIKLKSLKTIKIEILNTVVFPFLSAFVASMSVKYVCNLIGIGLQNKLIIITYLSISVIIYVIFLFMFKILRKNDKNLKNNSKKIVKTIEK